MLELKDAIKKAFEHFELIYEGHKLPNILLEEVEYDDSSDVWKVVIGFDSLSKTTTTQGHAVSMFGQASTFEENKRKYKQIRMKAQDGSFLKMVDEML